MLFMRRWYRRICSPFFILLVLFLCPASIVYSQTDVLTQHNDLARTGWNNQETILTTSNVNSNSFGFLFARPVDDQLFAQPLIASNVNIPSVGNRNIVYVCTVNNSVYAFDADNGNLNTPYWQKNFTPSGYRAAAKTDMHPGLCGGYYSDFSGNIGIVGTPVIDRASNSMYFLTKVVSTAPGVEDNHTWNSNVSNEEYTYTTAGFHQYLHAIDITTGAEKPNSPVEIIDTLPGTGDGSVNGKIGFDPRRQLNRAGLVLSRGIIYLCFAAHCDWDPNHGWILGYDATSLQLKIGYISTPNDARGGIWMSGAAPAVDAAGNLFVATGNSVTDENGFTDVPSTTVNRGESVVKLTPNAADNTANAFTISSFFTPYDYRTYDDADLDFGVQTLLIPGTNMLMTGVKGKFIYVLDQTHLGGYNANTDSAIQAFPVSSNAQLHSSFAYYGGTAGQYVYQFSENTLLQSFKVNSNSLGNPVSGSVSGPTGASGAYLSVSSNGANDTTAILWITHAINGCNANQSLCNGVLRAVRADDVTTELWNSTIKPSDNLGNFSKMNCPTIANGKVYVNTFSNQLMVYGLNNSNACDSFPDIASLEVNTNATYAASSNSGTAVNAFDGNQSTGWTASTSGAGGGDSASITVNLGAKYDICKVSLYWGSDYGKAFMIEGSNDDSSFTNLYTTSGNNADSNIITLPNVGYQYIRMQGLTRSNTNTGYVIDEMEVFGQLSNPCSSPAGLSATNITQNTATLNWQAVAGATNYTIQYKTSLLSNWITRTTTSTSINISALSCNTGYIYTLQATCALGTSAPASGTFTTTACTANCGPLPTRYFNADIGDIGVAGSSCLDNGIYTIQGSGNDINGVADEFQYAFTNLSGNEQVVAQVLTQDSTDPSNKAGLMFRDSISNTARFAFIGTTSQNGFVFVYRNAPAASATVVSVPGLSVPYWISLHKNATTYSAFVSPTGAKNSWVQISSTVDLGFGNAGANVGMAVSSHNNALLSTATFTNFSITDSGLAINPINFTGTDINNQYILLNWTIPAGDSSIYYNVQKSADSVTFSTFTRVNAAGNNQIQQSYSAQDDKPQFGLNYYRLQLVDTSGTFTYSKIISVNFGDQSIPHVFPNPASSYFIVTGGQQNIRELAIIDASGRLVQRIENSNGSSTMTINSEGLAGGLYIIQIVTTSQVYQLKLIKK
jgi:F5/8 type C domain-containing protein/type IX secretion system substrate protein/fibronectin type III domain protein